MLVCSAGSSFLFRLASLAGVCLFRLASLAGSFFPRLASLAGSASHSGSFFYFYFCPCPLNFFKNRYKKLPYCSAVRRGGCLEGSGSKGNGRPRLPSVGACSLSPSIVWLRGAKPPSPQYILKPPFRCARPPASTNGLPLRRLTAPQFWGAHRTHPLHWGQLASPPLLGGGGS